jgi:hypothetical protein
MGTWSVMSVVGRHTDLDSPFGHNFWVTIRMKYSATMMGKFTEPPILAWDETILVIKHDVAERWEFVGNMYKHKPASPTVAVWGQRYFRAYLHAKGTPFTGNIKGHSKLFDKNGAPVPGSKLGTYNDKPAQNKAVQDYLKNNGGILEIEIHDIPGISVTPGQTKNTERVLIFNCGVEGMGTRVKAWQHLKVDSSQPQGSWYRRWQMDANPPGLKVTGLKLVTDYAQVPNPTPAEGAIHET